DLQFQTPETDSMAAGDVVIGTIFLSQTIVGVLGNSSLLYHFLFIFFTKSKLKSTDLILWHSVVANFLTLMCKGVPHTMAAFGLKDFLDDFGCKLLFYLHRVGRGVSIGSTCLLSIFQAITISPRVLKWRELKAKVFKYFGIWIYLSWTLNLLINIVILKNITGKQGNKNITILQDFGYCSSASLGKTGEIVHAIYLLFPDVMCVGLMLWASSSMVLILHRHKQRMRHMQRTTTQTILLLVSTFVFFYSLSSIFHICLALVYNPTWFLVNVSAIVSGCFPSVSCFLLMSHDSSAWKVYFPCLR
uniref:Vomeronasal type-1 receptor n=1 Tax=Nannospalax galili TaxID=1026970 RepID=A0A8C6RR53_NANGA